MPLPTAYGTVSLDGALPEAYPDIGAIPITGGALGSAYGQISYAVSMTAAASGSNGITVADDDDIDFGTGDFFLHWEGSLPDWTPASNVTLIRKNTDATTAGFFFNIDDSPSGLIFAGIRDGGAILRTANSTLAIPSADGGIAKITTVVVRETASVAGSFTFYVNGTQLGSSVAITAGAPFSISNALSLYVSGSSAARTASNTISCIVGNFAPTAAEVLGLCTNGIPESWKWGSQTSIYASNFSSGVDGFSAVGGGSVDGNIDGPGGLNDWLRFTTGTSGTQRAARSVTIPANKKQRAYFVAFRPASNTAATGIRLRNSISGAATVIQSWQLTADTTTILSIDYDSGAGADQIQFQPLTSGNSVSTTAGDLIYLQQIDLKQLGATMALLPNSIPTSGATAWEDSSGNTGGGTLPAAGATKVTIQR